MVVLGVKQQQTKVSFRKIITLLLLTAVLVLVYLPFRILHGSIKPIDQNIDVTTFSSQAVNTNSKTIVSSDQSKAPSCAILLWGLPRAFESLVLPSMVNNVIIPNAQYQCDYYVHFFHVVDENEGRSGAGGTIKPEDIYKIKDAVDQVYLGKELTKPVVDFAYTKLDDFWKEYKPLIEKIRTVKDDQGRYLYFPWKAKTYKHPDTTDNIIKMWHTIQSAWNLMKAGELKYQKQYTRVAMIRSDVMYITPLEIYRANNKPPYDSSNQVTVLPGFGKYPVSDRLIYGPAAAVEIWATQRFARLDAHVQYMLKNVPGFGLHSERFVNYALLPDMRKVSTDVIEDDRLCFLRARADESVWTSDCEGPPEVTLPKLSERLGGRLGVRQSIEHILQRKCSVERKIRVNVRALDCKR